MRKITKDRAQKLCAEWHGGQWSALYSYASTGIYFREYALKYLQEIQQEIERPEYAPVPFGRPQYQQRELLKLKTYFENQGVQIEWGEHPVYGYQIPYVHESVNDDGIQAVSYLR